MLIFLISGEPGPAGQQQQSPRQKSESSKSSGSSSVDLYKNMVMFEQEQNISDDDDDDDNNDDKDNDDSLLSVITDGVKDDETFDDQPTMLLKCASCSGILPLWRDQRNSIVDEQSFCLPDVGSSTIQQGKTLTGHENYQSVCTGAVRVSI